MLARNIVDIQGVRHDVVTSLGGVRDAEVQRARIGEAILRREEVMPDHHASHKLVRSACIGRRKNYDLAEEEVAVRVVLRAGAESVRQALAVVWRTVLGPWAW